MKKKKIEPTIAIPMTEPSEPTIAAADSARIPFHEFVLRDCQKAKLPCFPDINEPILSVLYFGKKWCGVEGNSQLAELSTAAHAKGLVVVTIRRHACVRLSTAWKLVID